MRAFIGIDFDKELKAEIYKFQQKLKKYAVKGRWKNVENLHLTLKFLDEINPDQQEKINKAMEGISIARKPFNLAVAGMGIFNGRGSIRVLWLGMTGDMAELQSLYAEIDKALNCIGLPMEKRTYKPHITIGQDIIFEGSFDRIQEELGDPQFNSFRVDSLFLFRSDQIQNKRVYSKSASYSFTGNSS